MLYNNIPMNSENKNGKVYSIRCHKDQNLIYIGSTYQPLSKRFYDHKKEYQNDDKKHRLLYQKMNEIGFENFYIELVINVQCENKEELRRIEGEYIRKLGNLNKRIEGRTIKEYRLESPAQKEASKRYYDKIKTTEKYKETRNKNMKSYHERNKENEEYLLLKRANAKEYYNKNKERVIERVKQNYFRRKDEESNKSTEENILDSI
jgi:hypothetical protein